ncbi:MAG: lysoplasmalogenase family protein [Vulcanibacillus sp.]
MAIYFPITLLILSFDRYYPGEDMVQYLKYTVMITLFILVFILRKNFLEQRIMAASFFFLVIGDFFLVFSTTLDNLDVNITSFGTIGFFIAYIFLIVAYQKNFKVGKAEIITAIPVVMIFLYVFVSLRPNVDGLMLIGILMFGIVLCYMTWSAICTIYRKYYKLKTALLIALSGILMFTCDIGVAYSQFYPLYSEAYVPWLKNIIWAAYIPGWTLLAVIISEKNLRMK